MPAGYRDLYLAMRFLQVDSSWYENHWLKERKLRPAGMVTRNLPTIVSCLHLACDRVVSVRRSVLAIVLRPRTDPRRCMAVPNSGDRIRLKRVPDRG